MPALEHLRLVPSVVESVKKPAKLIISKDMTAEQVNDLIKISDLEWRVYLDSLQVA